MKTVVLEVDSLTDSVAAATRAWKTGKAEGAARISFASAELLWKVLTAKRLEILKAMTAAGGLTIREIAHRVGRDIKAVHSDVKALQMAGVLDKSPEGRAIFPYDEVRVNFSWHGRPHTKRVA
jgi:predicted transcriptional regulator